MSGPFAFVTLLSSNSYLPGALVLAASLKDIHPSPPQDPEVDFKTVCLVTPETVDVKSIKSLRKAFDIVIGVELIEAPSSPGLQLLAHHCLPPYYAPLDDYTSFKLSLVSYRRDVFRSPPWDNVLHTFFLSQRCLPHADLVLNAYPFSLGRPDLTTVLTKLHAFRLTEYSKIIYLDADILPLQPLSHLFLTPHEFSACPDVGWPDIFNSGCMVFEPGQEKFEELTQLMKTQGSWDGADQGLLNEWRGDNWNRLSFTYNTTPTAAYTYAPAYKRFGNAIKAIHFIGQNKPWASIAWCAPIEHPSAASMNSYGYGDLVDRWFAIYDRHYRPPVFASEEEYRVQHYAPVWETAAFEASSQGLGLDDLKRMAIEGVSQTSVAFSGEGEYKSLPLDGRLDLMRPRRPDQPPQPPTNMDTNNQGWQQTQDTSAQHRDQTDHSHRPPGREGLPSYLYHDPQPQLQYTEGSHVAPTPAYHGHRAEGNSQEPEHHQQDATWDHQQGNHDHQESHSPVYRPPSPPLLVWNPAVDPPPNNPPPIVTMVFNEQQYVNTWDLPAGRPMYHQQDSYHDPWASQTYSYRQPPYQQSQEPSNQMHGHAHHNHQQNQYQHFGQGQQDHRHEGSFPVGVTYDPSHSHSHQENTYPGHSHGEHYQYQPRPDTYHGQEPRDHSRPHREPRPEDFFKAPTANKIPSHLVREGHYAAVTTSEPRPDVAKVGAIFPWEQRSRPAPKRVFPDWDPKPPGLKSPPRTNIAEIEEALIATAARGHVEPLITGRRSPSPPPHIQRKFNPPPSPPLRQGSIYVNAWDTDFGIQRYASKLQGRSSPFSPQPWPSHPGQEAHASKTKKAPGVQEEEEEYTNWNEKAEASSRDGDDEDDEEDEAILSPKSSARRRAAKAKGNSYRHQGVQTDPKVTYSRGVQVSSFSAYKRPTEWDAPSHRNSYASNGYLDEPKEDIEQQAYGMTGQEKPLLPAFEEELADPAFRPSTALHDAEERAKAGGEIGSPTAPVLRKRDSSEDSVTTAAESSIISSPTKEVEEVGTPRVRILLPEQADVSPVSGRAPAGRRGGRVFSPTTGVDIFKRGSEEVLARFLMQDPSVWGGNRQTTQDPPTPSTIH